MQKKQLPSNDQLENGKTWLFQILPHASEERNDFCAVE